MAAAGGGSRVHRGDVLCLLTWGCVAAVNRGQAAAGEGGAAGAAGAAALMVGVAAREAFVRAGGLAALLALLGEWHF